MDKPVSEMTEDEFMKYHNTGFIPSNAYDGYQKADGLNWIKKDKYPILHSSKQFGDKTIEFKQSGEKNKYVKTSPDKDGWDEILRDEKGNAIYLSDEEALEKGYKLYDTSIVAFDGDLAIGLASDEWGADGIWVIGTYQRLGIGLYLLSEFRKQFPESRKIGQMTNAGDSLSRAYFRKLKEKLPAFMSQSWYKIAQIHQNLRIEKESLSDRTTIYLINNDKRIGKLTIQYSEQYYTITAFKIDERFRGMGWGRKMMEEILKDSKFEDKPILVDPAPYGGNIGSPEYMDAINGLREMYGKYGFKDFNGSYMIRDVNLIQRT
jgi:ribosomal protein S18 acetylase RimI-like enzyme